MDEEKKMDLEFIQMRTLADPKLFMKVADSMPDHAEVYYYSSSYKHVNTFFSGN
jgi:hypothetical protein